ncbi:hypothetical protein DHEL01_v202459 [Diaporthe helianthi]|uniref:Rhodopsin domain-containing protein n=1 Tax=Diaporthe helianthi TaxID=158607 RepID=A0A2P5I9E9_DIAHE|nr:hypothetical protein DHEL01_v202459 [Diaporthe helianthi]
MGNFDHDFVVTLKSQSWSFYSVGIIVMIFRFISRARRLGATNFQADDYLMLLVAVLYTALIVCLNIISEGGGSNLYPPGLEKTFTAKDIQDRIYGSKVVVASEQVMLNLIYTIKVCMLIMYTRLTLGLRDQIMVRCLAVYVFIGWLATEIAFVTASLILRMALPWRQRIVIAFIFSLGIFVILAALLTKIFNLTDVYDDSYMLWYIREASVAVYTSNLPMIWPLLRDWIPCLRALTPGADRTDERQPARAALASVYARRRYTCRTTTNSSGKASPGTPLRSSSLEPAKVTQPKGARYDVEMAVRAIDSDEESKREMDRRRELEDQIGVGGWHDRSSTCIDQIQRIKTPPKTSRAQPRWKAICRIIIWSKRLGIW